MQSARDDAMEPIKSQANGGGPIRELTFPAMVRRGLRDSDEGKTITHDEMLAKIQNWHGCAGTSE